VISLPMYPTLEPEKQTAVIAVLDKVLSS